MLLAEPSIPCLPVASQLLLCCTGQQTANHWVAASSADLKYCIKPKAECSITHLIMPAGILDVTPVNQPPVAWIFSNMKLVAVIGGAIAAAGIALMIGLALLDCCFSRAARKKVAAA